MKLLIALLVTLAATTTACVSSFGTGAQPPKTSASTSAVTSGSGDCSISTSPGITCLRR